jgi:signal transduction histidine kinase
VVAKKRQGQSASDPTVALERRVADLEADLERARGVGDALRRVGMAVGATVDPDQLLSLVIEVTSEVLDADRATLYLVEGDALVSRVKQGDELETIEVRLGQGIAGHVAATGRALRIDDAYRDERFDPSWDERSGYRTTSIMAVPISDHSGVITGVLQVLNKRGKGKSRAFTATDEELLTALATQVGVSLDKASLFRRLMRNMAQLESTKERLERSLRDLELLYELETLMGRAESVSSIAQAAVSLTARAASAAAGALLHNDEGTHTLYVIRMSAPTEVTSVVVQPGRGVAARALELGRVVTVHDPREIEDADRVRALLGVQVETAIAAPLGDDDSRMGAIALYNHQPAGRSFSSEDGALLKLVSANVSTELRAFASRSARERAERLGSLGRLLSGVMHDLRTPLTIISGYVELMEASNDPSERAQAGATIREQFDIIGAMQRDLLAYARGETSLLVRKVLLAKFCDDLARQFRPQLAGGGIELEMDVRTSGIAFFDQARLERAIQSLVQNALEAMEGSGGKLTLRCEMRDDELSFSVIDTGRGVPQAILGTLFLPFVTAGKKAGTGLGLANVKKIVEEHGGSVMVDTSSAGSCFTLRIPNALQPLSLRPQGLAKAGEAAPRAKS